MIDIKVVENKRCSNCVFCNLKSEILLNSDNYKPEHNCFKDFVKDSSIHDMKWDITKNYCDYFVKNTESNFENFVQDITIKYIKDGNPVVFETDEEGKPAYVFENTFWVVAYDHNDPILKLNKNNC